jgi:hypothetical protein
MCHSQEDLLPRSNYAFAITYEYYAEQKSTTGIRLKRNTGYEHQRWEIWQIPKAHKIS